MKKVQSQLQDTAYLELDSSYLPIDKSKTLRTKNLDLIPNLDSRVGGKIAYGEWCYLIGVFQTLLLNHLREQSGNFIVDLGCGTALMANASRSFIQDGGSYCGVDVDSESIQFNRHHYSDHCFSFKHLDYAHEVYAPDQQNKKLIPLDFKDNSVDVVTAISVFTHLSEKDARYYFQEISRILKVGGFAMATFFLLDEDYERSLQKREDKEGRHHKTLQKLWIYDQACQGSKEWFCPAWVKKESESIAMTEKGMQILLQESSLEIEKKYPGNWKEIPGVFFQDVIVFRKR